MTKVVKAVVLDSEDWDSLDGNKSKTIRELIRSYVSYKNKDISQIDEQILYRKKKLLENQKIKHDTELESINQMLIRIREVRDKEEIEKQEAEKQKVLLSKTCIGSCRRVLEEGHKVHQFKKGIVCHGCFMSATKEQIELWSTE